MKFLIKESKFKETIINNIDNEGLLNTLRVTNMSFTKLSSMIGMDFLTNKIMIQFIKDVSKENAGISIYDLDVDPIPYKKEKDEYSEITFFGSIKVTINVYSENGLLGDFHVMYENLNDDKLMEVFDLVMNAYEDGKLNI